ncbi:MAG: glycoside hydrolase family 31 protein [Niabella sp.]
MMKNYVIRALAGCIILCCWAIHSGSQNNNPVASNGAVIRPAKEVRITVLTPQLVRMEWNKEGIFNDHASFLVVNRELPVPAFRTRTASGWWILETTGLELRYRLHTGRFTAANLKVTVKTEKKITWHPGMVQQQNLKGTARTLDRCDGDSNVVRKQLLQLEDGILARDGWTLLDDSKNFLLDESPWPWVMERKDTSAQDWYFMGYGSRYKQALYDFTLIAGKEPLPPRYTFGFWWSRYWSYSDNELRDVVQRFERYNIPLDVLVLDMDWHNTDSIGSRPDAFGQRKWWTGWTWNKRLFPDPAKFLHWAHSKRLKTTLNLHPASGIAPFEEQYSAFAQRMNFDTSGRQNIPFEGSNKKFMQALFDVVLRPMEKQGVDFWWLDWQQWLEDKKIKGLQNTWWLNYTFFTDMEKNRSTRPLLYHRWGGLGNHRYQVGLSGDVIISWKSLEYQPYFTNTASNVLYGYWSHDIGGHTYGKQGIAIDPELQTRWVQYGALNPVFRTHSSKNPLLTKEPWSFKGAFFDAQYDAIRLRYMLAPYIYTMARYAYDTGISLCRPMYYDYPEKEEAYRFNRQYLFGNDILVAPIGHPMVNGFSTIKVWLPPGSDWYEWHTGTLLKGGQVTERKFSIDEYPIYIKAGAILPMYTVATKNLDANPADIKLGVFPGGTGSSTLYEDNGNDQQYDTRYGTTGLHTRQHADGSATLTIDPVKGRFPGMNTERNYEVVFYGSLMPEKISVNGQPLAYTIDRGERGWQYEGDALDTRIFIPAVAVKEKCEVHITYKAGDPSLITNGMIEKTKRLSVVLKTLKDQQPNLVIPHLLGRAEETNRLIEYHPEDFTRLVQEFNNSYSRIPEIIQEVQVDEATKKWIAGYLHPFNKQ